MKFTPHLPPFLIYKITWHQDDYFETSICNLHHPDLGWPWPAPAWNLAGSQQWKQQVLATRQVALQKIIYTKRESSEASKALEGKRLQYLWIDYGQTVHEHTLRLPELHLHSSLNHLYGAFLPGFLWPIILICLVHTPCLVYLRIFPCVRMRR